MQLNIDLTNEQTNTLKQKLMNRYHRDHLARLQDAKSNQLMCNHLRKLATEENNLQPHDLVSEIANK